MQVTIALAVYNPNLSFLKQQIESIQNQTHKNWQCVVFDDASPTITLSQLTDLVSNDSRFEIYRLKENVGSYQCFEKILQFLNVKLNQPEHPERTEYLALCDQDDIWIPEKLEKLLSNMTPNTLLIHSDLSLIDANNNSIHFSAWKKEGRQENLLNIKFLLLRNTITGCASLFRSSLLKVSLPFPSQSHSLSFHHDHWLGLCALIPRSNDMFFINNNNTSQAIIAYPQTLVKYRQHEQNVVGSKQNSFWMNIKKIIYNPYPIQTLLKPWLDRSFLYEHYRSRFQLITGKQLQINEFTNSLNFGLPLILFSMRLLPHSLTYFSLTLKIAASKFIYDLLSIFSKKNIPKSTGQ